MNECSRQTSMQMSFSTTLRIKPNSYNSSVVLIIIIIILVRPPSGYIYMHMPYWSDLFSLLKRLSNKTKTTPASVQPNYFVTQNSLTLSRVCARAEDDNDANDSIFKPMVSKTDTRQSDSVQICINSFPSF